MDPRVDFVESVLGFRFENGFRSRYLALGEPIDDLELWFRNAQVFLALGRTQPISESSRHDLLTMIECIRLDAQTLYPPVEGLEDLVFNTSSYSFPKEVEACKLRAIALVLAQEDASSSIGAKN